ncbi:toll/interleukin-1 receptor domain-containing protein [Chitinophaga deserti]|uniref:toll/interleukin-1 receptor domain-containing protein n=1 Tax=Chitinophaga deserti TaxID=2164099 RepID=UPI000D6C8F88|nr:toll/interleukin-1 receptor domain-containing protein [Chitinophaga deserti]
MKYDVFICHASEDKDDFVRPLAEKLSQQNIIVWYDEFSLSIGDSLSQKIDEGLANSHFGIVVLSPSFFRKPWAKRELSGLTAREMIENKNLILPIWHRVEVSDVLMFSPSLADKRAANSANGINSVIREITNKVKPNESPLIVARDFLLSYNLNPPPISDEWWFDLIEYKEFLKFPDINAGKRWIFPLPYPDDERGRQRGLNIASTCLQIDWSFEGEELNISPITHPEKVHEYIRRWPGLYECSRQNAETLALYVPQITIPGFDSGFEDVFDELMNSSSKKSNIIFSYGDHETVDSKKALCADIIAFRHPEFGNYTKRELGRWYFTAHNTAYSRSNLNVFEGLIWLLSENANWLPNNYRNLLIEGILSDHIWASSKIGYYSNSFLWALRSCERNQFTLSKDLLLSLTDLVEETLRKISIVTDPKKIVKRLLEIDIVSHYYSSKEKL